MSSNDIEMCDMMKTPRREAAGPCSGPAVTWHLWTLSNGGTTYLVCRCAAHALDQASIDPKAKIREISYEQAVVTLVHQL